jgi:hypothetical protein
MNAWQAHNRSRSVAAGSWRNVPTVPQTGPSSPRPVPSTDRNVPPTPPQSPPPAADDRPREA